MILEHIFGEEIRKKTFYVSYGYELDAYCNIQDEENMGLPVFAPQPIPK